MDAGHLELVPMPAPMSIPMADERIDCRIPGGRIVVTATVTPVWWQLAAEPCSSTVVELPELVIELPVEV